ncbi:MAG: DUF559 domain-containing protein [Paludibacteraceae bacterium]|nr:DUF559 domain-containing protein [Paludibacteraceae bacterium]
MNEVFDVLRKNNIICFRKKPIKTSVCTRFVDIVIPSSRLFVELDGKQHEEMEETDKNREEEILSVKQYKRFKFLRITNKEIIKLMATKGKMGAFYHIADVIIREHKKRGGKFEIKLPNNTNRKYKKSIKQIRRLKKQNKLEDRNRYKKDRFMKKVSCISKGYGF